MSILDIKKIKKIYPAIKLKKTLDNLILQIESIKSDYNLDKIFNIISDSLLEINVGLIISIIDDEKENIIFKHIKLDDSNKLNFNKVETNKIRINKLNCYKKVFNKKQTSLCKNSIAQLKVNFPQIESILNKKGEENSIISPLVLRGEIIGFLEFFSKDLDESNIKNINIFSQELVLRVANTILFHEVKKSEERFKELWDNAPIAYHILDTKGIIRDVNKTEAKMLGYPRELMIGRSIFEFILPEQRADARQRFFLKLRGEKIQQKDDRIYVKSDKTKIYVSIDDILEYDKENNVIGVRTTMIDITKRKHAEQEIERHSQTQDIINKLLKISLKEYSLEEILDQVINTIISIPWIALMSKGGIWLVEDEKEVLVLKTQKGFTDYLLTKCSRISFGECICGRAAKKAEVEFVNDINKLHKIKYKDMSPHGHYCVPIIARNKVLGIINLYIEAGHRYDVKEIDFLKAVAGVVAGIIERKKSEIALRQSEVRFRQFFENKLEYSYIVSSKGIILDVNKAALTTLGYLKSELVDQHIKKIYAPESSLKMKRLFKTWKRTGKIKDEEMIILTKQGDKRIVLLGVEAVKTDNGRVLHSVSVQKDITERKLAEEEIRRLSEFNQRIINNSPVSIVVLDKQGLIIAVNDLAKKLMAKTEEQLVGNNIIDIRSIKNNNELTNRYRFLLEKGKPFYFENMPYDIENSTEQKYLNIIVVPLFNKNKKVDGAISMALDNTEAVLAKQNLENLNKELEQKVIERTHQLDKINKELNKVLELKSEFIADASHELRTPLTIMQGNLDLADKEFESSKKEMPETFGLINKEVEHMTNILTDLTILTNADEQSDSFIYEKVNIEPLIKAVNESLKILAAEKQIKIKFVNKNNNLTVMGDETKLEKMLLNIIRNAIKYNKHGGWIKIWTDQDKHEVRITVADGGIGIPKKYLSYIFERFYRVDKSRSRSEGGSGLGLAICKWIAEAHGGRISAESKLGLGSKFIIRIPYNYKKQKRESKLI